MNFEKIYHRVSERVTKECGLPETTIEKNILDFFEKTSTDVNINSNDKKISISVDEPMEEAVELNITLSFIMFASITSYLTVKRRRFILLLFSVAELCLIGLSIYYRNIYITLWFGLFMILYSIDFTRSWKQYLEAKKMLEKTIDDIAEHRKEVKEKEGSQKSQLLSAYRGGSL